MTAVKTRIHVEPDGTLTGRAGLPAGDHEVEIVLVDGGDLLPRLDAGSLLARVRIIQEQLARSPVRDDRSPDQILGYNENGFFN